MIIKQFLYKKKIFIRSILFLPFEIYILIFLVKDFEEFEFKHILIFFVFFMLLDNLWQLFGRFQIDILLDKVIIKKKFITFLIYSKTITNSDILNLKKELTCEKKYMTPRGFGSWELLYNCCLKFELVSNKSYIIEVINEKICDDIISNFNKIKKIR